MARAPLLRVPYTDPFPAPRIIPAHATTTSSAVAALVDFLAPSLFAATTSTTGAAPRSSLAGKLDRGTGKTLLLTGAGISVASGLADYRDSFHPIAHPSLPTTELHGYLRNLLSALNPSWSAFLAEMLESGALDTENPVERRKRGLKANPDGDVDVPNAPYTTFRYPACPTCLKKPPMKADGSPVKVRVDADGAWDPGVTAVY
ncbi:hypothetical protein CFE70_008745 [Pyrenophora teres f. teres 0-1]